MVENFQKTSRSTGDFSNQKKVQKTMADNLKPLLETLKNEDRKLDATEKNFVEEELSKFTKDWAEENPLFPKAEVAPAATSGGGKERIWDQSMNNGRGGFR